jgi:dynein heavy chain
MIIAWSAFLLLLLGMSTQVTADLSSNRLVIIDDEGTIGSCPSQERREDIFQHITASLQNILSDLFVENCGPGEWHQVASLNMSDPSQQCPSAWREYNTSGVRACGTRTPGINIQTCIPTSYPTSRQYSRVCGRAIGYQIGSPDAFGLGARDQPIIDSYYVYGVSITRGTPRSHIWTYAAGVSEIRYAQRDNCPCSKPDHPDNAYPPSFVGDNYYCESGNPTNTFIYDHIYAEDRLWDGQQCEGACCSNGKSPPWFSVELPNPTTDDIEVRICSGLERGDDVLIQLLELYIQ